MNLRSRLAALAIVFVVLLAGIGAFSAEVSRQRARAAERARTLDAAYEQALRLQSAYVGMESGQRGFAISAEESFLEPYESGSILVTALESELDDASRDFDGPTRSLLALVKRDGGVWRSWASGEVEARRTASDPAEPAAQSVGKQRFDALRVAMDGLLGELDRSERDANAAREHYARRAAGLSLGLPLVAVLAIIMAARLLNRWVVHPIRDLMDAVGRVTAGDLRVNVPAGGAPDVVHLASSVDAMRQTIIERLDEAERARHAAVVAGERANRMREAIEQSAIVALQLRTELAGELGEFPDGWSAAARLLPAQGWVAGDCYDVSLVAPDVMSVMVVDIAGHGASQAIMALKCKEILRAVLRDARDPGQALGFLAEQVGDLQTSFLTAFVVLIDTGTGRCRYASAGHPHAVLVPGRSPGTDDGPSTMTTLLPPTGPLLGVFPASWTSEAVQLGPGARLAIHTDGLTEARDAAGAFYGLERLTAMVGALASRQADDVIDGCLADLAAFSPAQLDDDVTMVVVCRDASGGHAGRRPFHG